MTEPIPVTVVTGFLGAGKTTLVNHWLASVSRGEVAVIVNELGDVGIDGELLAERAERLIEIAGGCVCCTTRGDLIRALDGLATSTAPPKRILVEASGVASPAGVLIAISRGGRDDAFRLDGVIAVVDATRVDALLTHDVAFEQLGYADIVVLSRTDQCDREGAKHALDTLRLRNGAALFVEGAHGEIVAPELSSLEALLDARRADFAPSREVRESLSPHVYESISLLLDGDVDGERFADFVESELAEVGGRLFRTKGILGVAGVDARMIVQGVADAIEVTFGAPWGSAPRTSRLVVIGFGLDRTALATGFAACGADHSRASR